MNKSKLDTLINKYHLGGEVETVKIQSTNTSLAVDFITDDKTLLGSVTFDDKEFPVGEYGIYTTSQLKSLLSVLDTTVSVETSKAQIEFSDKDSSVVYVLADAAVLPVVPSIKELPEFEATISIDDNFIQKYIKAKGALPNTDTFTFISKSGESEIVLGYSSMNTNRISTKVDAVCTSDVKPISFSANYLKQILIANRGSDIYVMQISSAGLCKLTFTGPEFESVYYLTQII
jgi:hypothetical protein